MNERKRKDKNVPKMFPSERYVQWMIEKERKKNLRLFENKKNFFNEWLKNKKCSQNVLNNNMHERLGAFVPGISARRFKGALRADLFAAAAAACDCPLGVCTFSRV